MLVQYILLRNQSTHVRSGYLRGNGWAAYLLSRLLIRGYALFLRHECSTGYRYWGIGFTRCSDLPSQWIYLVRTLCGSLFGSDRRSSDSFLSRETSSSSSAGETHDPYKQLTNMSAWKTNERVQCIYARVKHMIPLNKYVCAR